MDLITEFILDKITGGRLPKLTAGAQLVSNGNGWEAWYGDKNQEINGDFNGKDRMKYVLNLTENKTIRVGVDLQDEVSDSCFGLFVIQGTTPHQLTLVGADSPILWPDSDIPQRFKQSNLPEAMDTANTAYMVIFYWSAAVGVLWANVAFASDLPA